MWIDLGDIWMDEDKDVLDPDSTVPKEGDDEDDDD